MTPGDLLRHLDEASCWPQGCGLDMNSAYAMAAALRKLRQQRGEIPRGFKIGFTDPENWDRFKVRAPAWGTVYDTTLTFCDGTAVVSLAGTCQPRAEPECVFGMGAQPPHQATLDQLLECIAWVAPAFEIVQSHMDDWQFEGTDTVADGGMHARLVVGRKVQAAEVGRNPDEFAGRLASASVALHKNGVPFDRGTGSKPMGGPLAALKALLELLERQDGAPPLRTGDVVATGRWAGVWPVAPGETWVAQFDSPLSRLEVSYT